MRRASGRGQRRRAERGTWPPRTVLSRRMCGRRLLAGLALFLCLLLASCSLTARQATSGQGQIAAPVVIVGVGGLTWDAVSPEATPRLWELLTGEGTAAGATAVRQIGPSCPVDGWLSLSSGRATAGPRWLPERANPALLCGPLPEVHRSPDGEASIPKWQELQDLQDSWEFAPQLGLLADSLDELDVCATAVGQGAALALADADGVVDRYWDSPKHDAFDCPITVVDAGSVTNRNRDLRSVDRHVGEVLEVVPDDASVLVTGISEEPGGRPELAAALLAGPGVEGAPRFLVTPSTRWDGVIRLLDLPSTLMTAVDGSDPSDLSGAPVRLGGQRPQDPAATVRALDDLTRADQVRRIWAADFRTWFGAVQIVVYGVALLALRVMRGRVTALRWGGRALTALLLFFAALPAAAYLATLTEWWEGDSPEQALWVSMAVIAAAIAVVAGRLPTRPLWWAAGGLSVLTFGVLVVDAMAGTPLHRGSLLGPSPALGGRFFGFGNDTFSAFIVVALLLAGAVAAELLARDRRRLAVGTVLVLGALTVLVDVWPTWGADIGGGLALLPGIALLALVVAGIDVTVPRLATAALGGTALVAATAFGDWLRPPRDRSHGGRFVQEAIDGQAWEIVARKAGYARDSLDGSLPMWVTLAVLAALAAAALRPERFAPACLRAAFAGWPTLRATLGAIGLTILLGSFLNDYGIRIATISLTMGLPFLALTCARAHTAAGTVAPADRGPGGQRPQGGSSTPPAIPKNGRTAQDVET